MRNLKKGEKCSCCESPAKFMGWVFLLKKRDRLTRKSLDNAFLKRYEPYCKMHYQEMMFGLYPYQCPDKKCRTKELKQAEFEHKPEKLIVWVDLTRVLDRKVTKLKCPSCSKLLICVEKMEE